MQGHHHSLDAGHSIKNRVSTSSQTGSWLCTKGSYRNHIAAWCAVNPNIRAPDSKNQWSPLLIGNARVAMLELLPGKDVCRKDFSSSMELSKDLKSGLPPSSNMAESTSLGRRCRIYILEGLAPDFISVLGEHFLMDPTFFMKQERTNLWGLPFEGINKTPYLPSGTEPENNFCLKYYELRNYDDFRTFSI